YWFGTCLRYLQDASVGTPLHGQGNINWNIEQLFSYLEGLELSVTARLGHKKLDDFLGELKTKPAEGVLAAEEAQRLGRAVFELRETLEAEIEAGWRLHAYAKATGHYSSIIRCVEFVRTQCSKQSASDCTI